MHVFPEGQRHNNKEVYAIVDNQSNQSLAKTITSATNVLPPPATRQITVMSLSGVWSVSEKLLAALHPGPAPQTSESLSSPKEHGGEEASSSKLDVTTCTKVCENGFSRQILEQDFPNQSLAKRFLTFKAQPYTLKTCAGVAEMSGRRACGYAIESVDGEISFPLPTLIECNAIPSNPLLKPHNTTAICGQ